jgi:hypothetical protein
MGALMGKRFTRYASCPGGEGRADASRGGNLVLFGSGTEMWVKEMTETSRGIGFPRRPPREQQLPESGIGAGRDRSAEVYRSARGGPPRECHGGPPRAGPFSQVA